MAEPVSAVVIGLAAVGWGISIAGWGISPKVSEWMKRASNGSRTLWDKLMKLDRQIQKLKKMLDEEFQANRDGKLKSIGIEDLIRKLKAATDKAQDIIDAIDYHCIETSIIKGKSVDTDSPHNTSQNVGITEDGLSVSKSLKSELNQTLEDIQKLMDELDKIRPFSNLAPCSGVRRPPTVSTPPEVVFGREDDLAKIQRMLRDIPADDEASSSTTKCYSVIGIHGLPGSGKTTLAQYVIAKEKEDGRNFDLFMWIHVPEKFSVKNILAQMLEAVSKDKSHHINNLDTMRENLEENLKDKKFFLVLDDVWYDETVNGQDKRDQLLGALNAGIRGSKILLTTRDEKAAIAFGAETPLKISDLEDEQYFKMFMHYALTSSKINEEARHVRFGREIASKLNHSPLAARTVAGQLRGKPIGDWERALRSDLLKDTMGVLWWSYRQLDEQARQCFAYCGMFPRGQTFERDKLVHQWMAQGFLTTTNGTEDMEDIGRGYFNDLLWCSFIQPDPDDGLFMIHDLVHDLAQRVAGNDCFIIEEGAAPSNIPNDVKHLFIECWNQEVPREKVLRLFQLRTIFVAGYEDGMPVGVWDKLLMKLTKLRAVIVPGWTGKVPNHIGELKHLRYLSFWRRDIYKIILPSTFGKLYHLQRLSVQKLCTVQYFPNMGRLTLLRELPPVFTVRKERGYEIHQLEKMNNIRGQLSIAGLENVENKKDAVLADLANKKYITDLSLSNGAGRR